MLTSLTAPALAPDAALPDRDRYLDPATAVRTLGRLVPGRELRPLGLVRAKYRIGESLRVVHRLAVDGEPASATARMFADPAAAARVARAPGVAHDPAANAVWWWFPDDRKLTGIDDVLRPSGALAASVGLPDWSTGQVAEYAPERSLTVRADRDDGTVAGYVKLYATDTVDVAALARRYDAVSRHLAGASGDCRAPRALGTTDRLLALEAMPGVHWHRLAGRALESAMWRLGRAIAELHSMPFDGLGVRPFGRLAPDRVLHSAELVAVARPDLADRLTRIRHGLAAGPPDGPTVLLHGDCHPKNALAAGPTTSLIDLDQAGLGDPAADLASAVARLRHGAVLGEHAAATATSLERALVDGYATRRALPPDDTFRWHLVAALVAERAIRAVNRVHLPALERLEELVDLTLAELEAVR